MQELEGFIAEFSTFCCLRIRSRPINQVTTLHPGARFHTMNLRPFKLGALEELDEVSSQFRALLIKELKMHDLRWRIANRECHGTVRSPGIIHHRLDGLVAYPLVEDCPCFVLVLEALECPIKESLSVEKI